MAVASLALYFAGVSIVAIIAVTAALAAIAGYSKTKSQQKALGIFPLPAGGARIALTKATLTTVAVAAASAIPFSMTRLFLTFLKIGAVAYGSGYVLLAFLRADFVAHLHWLTDKQLLDAIAAGMVTPGPAFASATFVGYLTGGLKGALLATLGMFLPSFVFIAIIFPFIPKLKKDRRGASISRRDQCGDGGIDGGGFLATGARARFSMRSRQWKRSWVC